MKRYYQPDLEKTLSGDVLYVAVEKTVQSKSISRVATAIV